MLTSRTVTKDEINQVMSVSLWHNDHLGNRKANLSLDAESTSAGSVRRPWFPRVCSQLFLSILVCFSFRSLKGSASTGIATGLWPAIIADKPLRAFLSNSEDRMSQRLKENRPSNLWQTPDKISAALVIRNPSVANLTAAKAAQVQWVADNWCQQST